MNVYERETVEFIPVTVTINGDTVTEAVEFAVTVAVDRPTDWAAPVELDGRIGVMTDHQDPGSYTVWARVTDSPEVPVIRCGSYRVT